MKTSKQAYGNWLLLSLFFSYQYLLRGYPGIFTTEIRRTFLLNSDQYSDFGAYCMLAYSFLQIPFGIALDRVGIRRLVLMAFALCLIGQYLFTHAQTFEHALLGRTLLGIGATPGYMSALKLVADSFCEKSCGLFIGLTGAMGNLAMAIFEPRLKAMGLAHQDWRFPAFYLEIAGLLLFVACVLWLRPNPLENKKNSPSHAENLSDFWKNLLHVAFQYKVYLYAAFVIGTNVLAATLADLWGKSFLNAKYNLGEQEAVNYVQWIQIGMLTGSVALPTIFHSGTKILWGIRVSCAFLAILFGVFIYGSSHLSGWVIQSLLFCVGFFGAADILACTLGAKMSNPQTSGMIISWINSVGMLGEPILEKWIGKALTRNWSGLLDEHGLHVYTASDYEFAISVMFQVVCVCLVLSCCLRRKAIATHG